MKTKTSIKENKDQETPVLFRKILVPTDFSACADQAFTYGLALARRYRAEVHLLHVIGPLEGDAYSPLRHSPEAHVRQETPDKIAYNLLQTVIHRHDTEGITIKPVKQHGSAVASVLLQYAKAESVDLIVMGTHGRHGAQRFIMGSVAERVVRQASCSVLTVREQKATMSPGIKPDKLQIQRILVPLDFSEHSEALLRVAHAMAVAYGAQLDLLHVGEMPLFVGIYSGILTANDLVPEFDKHALAKLQHLWEEVGGEEVQAKLHVEEGHAAAHIVDFAARFGVDLIVIASQGRSGIERFLIGSVAERVVRSATCPVLIFKPRRAKADFQETHVEEATSLAPEEQS
jgi:nucleotide-binding universal stress UspA family protein